MSSGNKSRDQGDVSTSQETPKIGVSQQEKPEQTSQSKDVRKQRSVILSHPVSGTLLQSPSKLVGGYFY